MICKNSSGMPKRTEKKGKNFMKRKQRKFRGEAFTKILLLV